jgi:hypothetical protein
MFRAVVEATRVARVERVFDPLFSERGEKQQVEYVIYQFPNHGSITIGVPTGTKRQTSSISRLVNAMQPSVQLRQ